ncbi:MAG: T9SS type A sorting domain-containing protein, partial [candidate division WOR-3 bacterium]
TPGPMLLTVNAHDHYIVQDTVFVIASDRYVCYLSSMILDPAGNNDSILNPGETVDIPTWVKNWGQLTAYGVTARLRTHDLNARVTDSAKTFGDIVAGDSAWTGTDGFGLQVSSSVGNGYAIACSLICRDTDDSVWVSNVTFLVGTAVLKQPSLVVVDTAHGGNGNGRVDPDETADLVIGIRNNGMGHGYNCRAVLRSTDARLHVEDSTALYGTIRKGDSANSGTDFFTVRAEAGIPLETEISCTLDLYADGGYANSEPVTVVVGEFRTVDPIPDGPRLPALYYAYDECDTAYQPHPTFEWTEISGVGTAITFSHNDAVVTVDLPALFGPFYFYGQRYTRISVSADGWIAPGADTTRRYHNVPLPDPSTPPGMVCLNWDDLYPNYQSQGYVYHYHDTDNHRFVIEYDSVAYYNPRSVRDKFQVLIYDTTVVTFTGDNAVVVQYMTANRYTSSTVGIEDPERAIAIQALYDGNYHRGCAQIAPGRAIKYTTDPPDPTWIAEETPVGLLLARRGLVVAPNPVSRAALVYWQVERDAEVSLQVFDPSGRVVRTLEHGRHAAGTYTTKWNGRDDAGRELARGIYFVRLEAGGVRLVSKTVLTE